MGPGRRFLIIDFTIGFNDPSAFGGGNITEAITQTVPLLAEARALALPVAHTRIVYAEDGSDANIHTLKVPRLRQLTESNLASHFVPELTPLSGEIVIRKKLPSAFFGTDLIGLLTAKGVDTLLIAGCTTSGCRYSHFKSPLASQTDVVAADCSQFYARPSSPLCPRL